MDAIFIPVKPNKRIENLFIKYLKNLYTNEKSSVAFSSPEKVLRKIKEDGKFTNIGINRLRRFMGMFDSYTLNRHRHKDRRQFRRYGLQRMNHTLELDLFTIQRYAKYNDNHYWILAAIDVFSKYGYLIALKDKTAKSVYEAVKTILESLNYKINTIHSDLGKEFKNALLSQFLLEKGIRQTFAKMSGHCHVVERFIKSIKMILKAYRLEKNTDRFIDNLPNLIELYNNRYHRSIGMSPSSVNEYNELFISDNLFNNWTERSPKQYKFQIGERVRIATDKTVFDKHDFNFSVEILKILTRERRDDINIYEISSCDDPVIGFFQESELVSVTKDENAPYEVDKFLAEKRMNNDIYVYVSFKNYPNNKHCNEWIRKRDIVNI